MRIQCILWPRIQGAFLGFPKWNVILILVTPLPRHLLAGAAPGSILHIETAEDEAEQMWGIEDRLCHLNSVHGTYTIVVILLSKDEPRPSFAVLLMALWLKLLEYGCACLCLLLCHNPTSMSFKPSHYVSTSLNHLLTFSVAYSS